jgi:hypothetical protein
MDASIREYAQAVPQECGVDMLIVGQQGQDKLMGRRRILCISHDPTVPPGHVEIQTPCVARPNIVGCSGAGIKAIEEMDINTKDAIILNGSFRGSVPIVNVPIENSHFFCLVFPNGETRPRLVTDSMYGTVNCPQKPKGFSASNGETRSRFVTDSMYLFRFTLPL